MVKFALKCIISSIIIFPILFFCGCEDKKEKGNIVQEEDPLILGEYILKFSHVVDPNTPKGRAASFFEKRLEQLSKNRIDVQVFPSSQLYTDDAVLKALKLDTVQMAAPSFSKFSEIVPQLELFDLPFLFKDMAHVHRMQDGKEGQKLKDIVNSKGYISLAFWDNNFKQLTSSKKALILPEDIKGQKIRIMSSKVLQEQFDILGAYTQMIPFSEVYSQLQRGNIDGQENTISNIYTKDIYKVQKYITMTNHGYLGYLVVMSKKFWDSLPQDLQDNVLQAVKEATAKQREYAQESNVKQFDLIKEYSKKSGKLKIINLTKEQRDAWKKAVIKIYPNFSDSDKIGEDLIKSVLVTE